MDYSSPNKPSAGAENSSAPNAFGSVSAQMTGTVSTSSDLTNGSSRSLNFQPEDSAKSFFGTSTGTKNGLLNEQKRSLFTQHGKKMGAVVFVCAFLGMVAVSTNAAGYFDLLTAAFYSEGGYLGAGYDLSGMRAMATADKEPADDEVAQPRPPDSPPPPASDDDQPRPPDVPPPPLRSVPLPSGTPPPLEWDEQQHYPHPDQRINPSPDDEVIGAYYSGEEYPRNQIGYASAAAAPASATVHGNGTMDRNGQLKAQATLEDFPPISENSSADASPAGRKEESQQGVGRADQRRWNGGIDIQALEQLLDANGISHGFNKKSNPSADDDVAAAPAAAAAAASSPVSKRHGTPIPPSRPPPRSGNDAEQGAASAVAAASVHRSQEELAEQARLRAIAEEDLLQEELSEEELNKLFGPPPIPTPEERREQDQDQQAEQQQMRNPSKHQTEQQQRQRDSLREALAVPAPGKEQSGA